MLYLLAIINKHRTPYHMRYMIATSLAIVGAGMRRVFVHVLHMDSEALLLGFLIPDLALVGLIVYDWVKGNNARAYIIAFIILAVSHYSIYFLPHTALWQSVAGYFVRFF
mgnify:CR=1 FL=1